MAVQHPLGVSYEVVAPDSDVAIENARIKADLVGQATQGRVLHVAQIEAGRWEVVLEDLSLEPTPERMLTQFLEFLRNDTDMFDPVIMDIAIHERIDIKPTDEQIAELVKRFIGEDS